MPHTRLLVLIGLLLGTTLAGVILRSGEILVMAVPFGLYFIFSWYFGDEKIDVEAVRTLSHDRITLGGEIEVTLQVTNKGAPLRNLQIDEILPDGVAVIDGECSKNCTLGRNESTELTYKLVGHRGAYRIAGIKLLATDTLDLFRKRSVLAVTSRLLILPKVQKLRRMELRTRQTRIFSGQIPAKIGGPGVEFHGVRPYQSGDPMRWLNARLSARHPDSLFVNQYEQERVADIGFILDARLASNMPSDEISLLEYSIEAAAALGDFLIDGGNRVGMLLYGGPLNWTFPGYGKIQKERMLQALANAELGANPIFEDLGYIPTRLFPLRTLLIIFSPFLEDDLSVLLRLRARGYQAILVSPDPISAELSQSQQSPERELAAKLARIERDLVLGQLRQAGVQVVDWDVTLPFQQIADRVLSRPVLPSAAPLVSNL